MVFGIVLVIVCVFVGLSVAAVILRAGISIANKVLGDRPNEEDYPGSTELSQPIGPRQTSSNPYAAGAIVTEQKPALHHSGKAIAEPSFGRAMFIAFVVALGQLPASAVSNTIDMAMAAPLGALIALPLNFVISAAIKAGMLSTTFGRASLVTLFEFLIVIGIALILFAIIFGFVFATKM
jgi:hypothetical protein